MFDDRLFRRTEGGIIRIMHDPCHLRGANMEYSICVLRVKWRVAQNIGKRAEIQQQITITATVLRICKNSKNSIMIYDRRSNINSPRSGPKKEPQPSHSKKRLLSCPTEHVFFYLSRINPVFIAKLIIAAAIE